MNIDNGLPVGRTSLGRWNKLVIRVPRTTYSELRSDAMNRGVSLNQLVNEIIGEPDQRRDIAWAVRQELARVGLVSPANKQVGE